MISADSSSLMLYASESLKRCREEEVIALEGNNSHAAVFNGRVNRRGIIRLRRFIRGAMLR